MVHDELRKKILLKTGLLNVTSRDCECIADKINQSLGRNISVTTLKRIFGFAKTQHSFSKYTLATLKDYIGTADDYMNVLSFIAEKEKHHTVSHDQICLHPRQLVLEALDILLQHDREFLSLVETGKAVGRVYTRDLICFLTCDDKMYGTIYHKFNFDLYTAIAILQQNNLILNNE